MIFNILISGIFAVLYALTFPVRILPDVSLSSNVTDAIANASGLISSINSFAPIDTLISVFQAVLVVEGLVLTYRIIVWVLTKIPGLSN